MDWIECIYDWLEQYNLNFARDASGFDGNDNSADGNHDDKIIMISNNTDNAAHDKYFFSNDVIWYWLLLWW